jgi:alkanesulfonate monooxygenase SsuD/methylene tetrahydromethanopterin reductase-like flavin-dependent oxidoreductase (luciferase family)
MRPSPQGHPVLVQAGASPTGRAFAARNAEVVFSAPGSIDSAREFYRAIKEGAASEGRDPDTVRIMPVLAPVIGQTDALAEEKNRWLQSFVDPIVGAAQVKNFLGVDISSFDPDGPIPEIPLASNQGRQKYILDKARLEGLTIRELASSFSGPGLIAGSVQTIADHIEEWVNTEAADGFMIAAPYQPEGIEDFVDHMVPELQCRGLFRTEYTGSTLRDHLRLPAPRSRWVPVG